MSYTNTSTRVNPLSNHVHLPSVSANPLDVFSMHLWVHGPYRAVKKFIKPLWKEDTLGSTVFYTAIDTTGLQAAPAPPKASSGAEIIKEAFDLVSEANIVFDPNFKDVHLVVGNTGTGKSTLVQFIAGDNSKLYAVKNPPKTGNIIIQDDDKISGIGSSTESKTLFPDLVINATREMAFYDCPGFKDSRGTAVDMAASYLTKMVFDTAEKIKVVICVEYETATGNIGRGSAFIDAIKHVGEFIQETAKFKTSFSMVATKVPKETEEDDDGNDIVIPDENLITALGDFIANEIIPMVTSKIAAEEKEKEKLLLKNSLEIFKALSLKNEDKYHRIGLFRKPQKEGPLDKSPLMIKSRAGIMSAIKEATEFTASTKDDFGFSVADNTKVEMFEIATELNTTIAKVMADVGEAIKAEVLEHMRTSGDWVLLQQYLDFVRAFGSQYAGELNSVKKLTPEFIKRMRAASKAEHINMSIDPALFSDLELQTSYLAFLESMLDKDLAVAPKSALDSSLALVNEARTWYKSLFTVYDKLSVDPYQEDRSKYNVANLDNWGKEGQPQGLRISAGNITQFYAILKIEYEPMTSLDLNEHRTNELNSVVHLTLADIPAIGVTPEGTLLATGPFIRLSAVMEKYKANEVKVINVQASCKVFIDTDVTVPGCHVVIVAPFWQVNGTPSITLDGTPGEDVSGTAPHGKGETEGENGTPGGPGGPSGHFIGIADEVANSSYLKISANGGRGGQGEGGGRGGPGTAGIDASRPSYKWTREPDGNKGTDWYQVKYKYTNKFWYGLKEWWWHIYAKRSATSGKRGGDGGAGGTGGAKGEVLMAINTTTTWPKIENEDGNAGRGGDGGSGGAKAKHGRAMKAHWWWTFTLGLDADIDAEWSTTEWYDNGYSSSGSSGNSGGNKSGQESATPQIQTSLLAPFVNDFKSFALGIAATSALRRSAIRTFLKVVDETASVVKLYDVSAYLNELISLESQFYALNNYIDLSPRYSSILSRITSYADATKDVNGKVDKLALGTVYASCLGKICSMRLDQKAPTVIVDLATYMDLTIKRIEELNAMDRRAAIKDFQTSYHSGIESKITEANQLIESKVNPAIEQIMRGMDDTLQKLVEETLQMIEDVNTSREQLLIQMEQMEKAMMIKGILGVVKMGAMVASFCGPIGAAVGGVITGGVTIGESFVVEPDVNGNAILVPPGVKESLSGLGGLVVAIRGKKIESLEAQLELIEKEIAGREPEEKAELQDVDAKVKELKEKLEVQKNLVIPEGDDAAEDKKDQAVANLEKELKDTMTAKSTDLKDKIAKGDKSKEKILGVVNKIDNGLKVVEAGLDVYNKFKDDRKKLDAIGESLRQADEAISELTEYERNIHSMLFPMVRNMRDDVNEVMASLSSKSQVALDVTKWEVQSTLNAVSTTLGKAMAGYESQAEMMSSFEQLNEALSLLMNIYDRLENFRDQQELGDYIANIGAPGDYTDLLKNTPYENDVRVLNMIIQSNLILLEFENVMHAFKQWVFPFARTYLEQNNLPPSLKPIRDDQTLQELVSVANSTLRKAKDNIARYWATIASHDKFFFESKFYSNEKIGGPFYLWTQKDHRHQIKKLFKGEEITLLSNVVKSGEFVGQRKAIKFLKVFIRFNLRGDESEEAKEREAKFNDLLEYFVVNMVHTGTSYYDFLDDYFVIPGDPVTLSYGILGASKGDPDIKSTSRDKILTGDLLLSPYTLWTLQLSADKKEAFKNIEEYVDDISLELAGKGTYIWDTKNEIPALDLRVRDYYQVHGNEGMVEPKF